MKREKRCGEALELYRQATEAVTIAGDRIVEANWLSKQADHDVCRRGGDCSETADGS
jgi:hypothetical protein